MGPPRTVPSRPPSPCLTPTDAGATAFSGLPRGRARMAWNPRVRRPDDAARRDGQPWRVRSSTAPMMAMFIATSAIIATKATPMPWAAISLPATYGKPNAPAK